MGTSKRRMPNWMEIAGWCILVALSGGRLLWLRRLDLVDAAILAISLPMLVAAVAGSFRNSGEPGGPGGP